MIKDISIEINKEQFESIVDGYSLIQDCHKSDAEKRVKILLQSLTEAFAKSKMNDLAVFLQDEIKIKTDYEKAMNIRFSTFALNDGEAGK